MKGFAASFMTCIALATAAQADTYCSAEIAEKDPWPGFPATMPATEAPYTPAPAPAPQTPAAPAPSDSSGSKIVPEYGDKSGKTEKDWFPNTEAPTPEAEKDWFPQK